MGKGKNKSAAAAKAKAMAKSTRERKPPPPPPVDGDKKIFASFVNGGKRPTWAEINPHNSSESEDWFAVDLMPKINSPPSHLDVSKLRSCSTLVHGSKVYFIGGQFFDEFINDDVYQLIKIYSDKIFTYHLFSHEWEELPCKLNIARSDPLVFVVGNEIYVMGGMVDAGYNAITNKEEWIEWFNIVDVDENKTRLDFLPADGAPPNAVFERVAYYKFAYEPRSEIVFVMSEALGGYSFNCISKTWAPFHENISKHASFICDRAVVVDHLVFLRYGKMMYAYDMIENQLVLSQPVTLFKYKSFGRSDDHDEFCPETSFLGRVGKDTLLLTDWVSDPDTGKHVHLYKFQIQNDDGQLCLLPTACGHFSPTGNCLIDVVVAG